MDERIAKLDLMKEKSLNSPDRNTVIDKLCYHLQNYGFVDKD